jgi:hypothetical protein
LAVLLEEKISLQWKSRKTANMEMDADGAVKIEESIQEVYSLYKSAHTADPKDPTTAADLGR